MDDQEVLIDAIYKLHDKNPMEYVNVHSVSELVLHSSPH